MTIRFFLLAAFPAHISTCTGIILIYTDTTGPCLFRFRAVHDFLDIRGEAIECLVDVDIVLC